MENLQQKSNKPKVISVDICAITFRRPKGLKRLLNGLNNLAFSQSKIVDIRVIVVDNDSTCSARQVCESIRPSFKFPLIYNIETRRGISFARNKAIACVSDKADFVAFIDDDEIPEKSWLEELLIAQERYDADVVSGPVLPLFPSPSVDPWVTRGKFFERPRYSSGFCRETAATNNVLVRREIFRTMDKLFDERFALTGGEDGHFFRRVYRAGHKIIWADKALVYELIPESRTNLKWLLKRTYRTHSTFSMHEQEFDGSLKTQSIAMIKAGGRIAMGVLLLIPSPMFGKHIFVKALLSIFGGIGRYTGLVGKTYQEYKT